MSETREGKFDWALPGYGVAAAVTMVLPQTIFGNGVGTFLGTILLAVLIAFTIVIIALIRLRQQTRSTLAMLLIFFMLAFVLFWASDIIRTTARWFAHSTDYKRQVAAQPVPSDGSLRHVEWDGWGFVGAGDTTVYLVEDPSDRLAAAAGSHSPGKLSGVPCKVANVHRLERHWYTVLFYTDTAWDYCGDAAE
jgi:cell division protein FtsW (lipid II flippase)